MSVLRSVRATPLLWMLACLALLSGCSLAPHYDRPDQELPAQWRSVDLGATPLHTDWWNRFNDPVLSALVEEALKNNQDLAQSLANIDSAAAQVGVATAGLLPHVSGSGEALSSSASEKAPNTGSYEDKGLTRSSTTYQGSLSAAWELDF